MLREQTDWILVRFATKARSETDLYETSLSVNNTLVSQLANVFTT